MQARCSISLSCVALSVMIKMGSGGLPDLTGQFTPRADDGHAPPLGSSGKIFSLAFILPSPLVIFPALNPIEPQLVEPKGLSTYPAHQHKLFRRRLPTF